MQNNTKLHEITFRGIFLGIILAIILAASNTYLALKIGILTSASIPAAIIAMAVLRFFKGSNILENNLVQTAASAGEAIAGGIVYTIPALIIIHYWTGFDYVHNLLIALTGGILGILFSVPLRRVLLNEPSLRFPEAQAITKTLELTHNKKMGIFEMLLGSFVGAMFEFAQSGLQIIASSVQGAFTAGKSLFGFGLGFSTTLIGAGYLIGFNVGLSLFIGAVTGWLIIIPIQSGLYHLSNPDLNATANAASLWSNYVRMIGVGAMLAAGVWTLITLLRPISTGIMTSLRSFTFFNQGNISRSDKDIPYIYVITGLILCSILCYFLLQSLLPISAINLPLADHHWLLLSCLAFILVAGFIFAAITGYFSGMVGVSASPGSAIVIGGLLLVAISIRALLDGAHIILSPEVIKNASAIVIVLISVITGIACITNDNIQDLKVGQLVGSTPWKQQLMLIIGVIAASAVVPLLMQLLFNVYGFAGVAPHSGMDPNKMLPAPVPAVLATVTQAVFNGLLPLHMLLLGVAIIIGFIILNLVLRRSNKRLSIIGIAMGLYLPLSSSTPLFIGSLIALWIQHIAKKRKLPEEFQQKSIVLACGIVAGAALMDVLLAIPFAISGNPNILAIMPSNGYPIAVGIGIVSILFLAKLFHRTANKKINE